jgi:integrative and conjugative element protein (TIGR02256 family)
MSGDLTFTNPINDGFVLIDAPVVRQICRHRQNGAMASEAGGILLGSRRGRHIEVTMATSPKQSDKQGRTAFHRLSDYHQVYAIRAWRRLGKTVDYVGEWHTHPESTPSPSGVDKSEWSKLTRTRANELLFLIVGIEGIWAGVGFRGKLRPLLLVHPKAQARD